MKKFDLLHTTVLIIAILCGYSALLAALAMLNTSFYISDIFYARSGVGTALLPAFVQAGIYAVLIYAAPALTNFIERTISPRLQTGSKTR
ncbi:MAG TPA: hypothetical protein VG101_04770 [Puia sp.]|jgi:hypothetical protein|nr:hypothetical protein [Puia sp.]